MTKPGTSPLTVGEVQVAVLTARLNKANELLLKAYQVLASWDEEWFDRTRKLLEDQNIDVVGS